LISGTGSGLTSGSTLGSALGSSTTAGLGSSAGLAAPVFFKPGKPPANKLPIPPCFTPKAANLKPPFAIFIYK
jgi:hypothetical protein